MPTEGTPPRDTKPRWLRALDAYRSKLSPSGNPSQAMDEWAAMDEADQRFVQAQLSFLNVEALGAVYGSLDRLHRMGHDGLDAVIRRLQFLVDLAPEEALDDARRGRAGDDAGDEGGNEGTDPAEDAPTSAADLPPGSEGLPETLSDAELDALAAGGGAPAAPAPRARRPPRGGRRQA